MQVKGAITDYADTTGIVWDYQANQDIRLQTLPLPLPDLMDIAKRLDFHSFKAQLLSPDVSGIALGTEGTKLSSSASAADE